MVYSFSAEIIFEHFQKVSLKICKINNIWRQDLGVKNYSSQTFSFTNSLFIENVAKQNFGRK